MFNGIIFSNGKVAKVEKRNNGINLFIKSSIKLSQKNLGVSVACDGVCLTLISYKHKVLEFYLSKETLEKSKFKFINKKDLVNLELPIKFGQKISGHICQGHVDTVGTVISIKKIGKSYVYDFKISKIFKKYLVAKASILINGVSLTISKIKKNSFEIWVIPHTLKLTNLKNLKKSDLINIEIDFFAKYIKKFLNEKK